MYKSYLNLKRRGDEILDCDNFNRILHFCIYGVYLPEFLKFCLGCDSPPTNQAPSAASVPQCMPTWPSLGSSCDCGMHFVREMPGDTISEVSGQTSAVQKKPTQKRKCVIL